MAIFDSSILAAGRLDQREENRTSRRPAASQLCDSIADQAKVVMKTKVTAGYRGTELLWRFGTLTRACDPTKDKRYGALYHYDLSLVDQKGTDRCDASA